MDLRLIAQDVAIWLQSPRWAAQQMTHPAWCFASWAAALLRGLSAEISCPALALWKPIEHCQVHALGEQPLALIQAPYEAIVNTPPSIQTRSKGNVELPRL